MIQVLANSTQAKDEQLAKLLLKKIRLEMGQGQAILQISDKHNQITEMLETCNQVTKVSNIDELRNKGLRNLRKSFTYVIADMDSPQLDDFDNFLQIVAPMIIRPGLLIIVATNLCTTASKIDFCFGNAPKDFTRPLRAVPPGYLRNKLLEKGFFIKNRFWHYDDKLLIMADIPLSC
jgi:hypothetical protein